MNEETKNMEQISLNPDKRPIVTEGIYIKELKGADGDPKYAYRATRMGQANYIMIRCQEDNIACLYVAGEVQLYSRRKLPQFVSIVTESFQYDLLSRPEVKSGTQAYWEGPSLLCVYVDGVVYLANKNMPRYKMYVYKKDLPSVELCKVYRTKNEMIQALMEEKNIVV